MVVSPEQISNHSLCKKCDHLELKESQALAAKSDRLELKEATQKAGIGKEKNRLPIN